MKPGGMQLAAIKSDGISLPPETSQGLSALSSQLTHLGARDFNEIVRTTHILGLHDVISLVVVDGGEWQDLHVVLAGRHSEHISAVVAVIQVVISMSHSDGGTLHARGIRPATKKVAPALRLDLAWNNTSVGPA